jgi:hypothetical protein
MFDNDMKDKSLVPGAPFWFGAFAISYGIQIGLAYYLDYEGWDTSSSYWFRQVTNPPSMAWLVCIIPTFLLLAYFGIKWPRWIPLSWFIIAILIALVSYPIIPRMKV